jgi:hypothetical protein
LEIKPLLKPPDIYYRYVPHSTTLLLGMDELGYKTTFYNLIYLGLFTFFVAPGLLSEIV